MHIVAALGQADMIRLLLENKVDINVQNQHAIHLKNRSKVLALLNYGSDVEDLEYVEADLGFAFWDTLDSVRVDLSPK